MGAVRKRAFFYGLHWRTTREIRTFTPILPLPSSRLLLILTLLCRRRITDILENIPETFENGLEVNGKPIAVVAKEDRNCPEQEYPPSYIPDVKEETRCRGKYPYFSDSCQDTMNPSIPRNAISLFQEPGKEIELPHLQSGRCYSYLLGIFHRKQHSMRRRLERGFYSAWVPFSVPNDKRNPLHVSQVRNRLVNRLQPLDSRPAPRGKDGPAVPRALRNSHRGYHAKLQITCNK